MSYLAKTLVNEKKFFRLMILVLFFLLGCRIFAMCFIPLTETTEARYGEIARKMLETNNWITPWHDYGIPFWAKPPLSFWLSALSMKYLGINEFAVRLPSLLLSIGIVWLVWHLVKKRNGAFFATITTVILVSNFAFMINAGAVMTDASLLFCITLSLVSFWQAIFERRILWGYLFFVGLGLGLLAKGPIAIILTGMPLFLWTLIYHKWREAWNNLPWITGPTLMLLIGLPWYIMAEHRTPGFLNYFILGEHFGRFLEQGWQGDKYGNAHAEPYGMIWFYFLVGACPWTVWFFIWAIYNLKNLPSCCKDNDGWFGFWLLTFTIPLLFFSAATNIISTYILPSIPAFSVLFATCCFHVQTTIRLKRLLHVALFSGAMIIALSLLFIYRPDVISRSEKPIAQTWLVTTTPYTRKMLLFWADVYSEAHTSGNFYTAGHVRKLATKDELIETLAHSNEEYLVLNKKNYDQLPKVIKKRLYKIRSFRLPDRRLSMYHFYPRKSSMLNN